jgi:hypothetical protein
LRPNTLRVVGKDRLFQCVLCFLALMFMRFEAIPSVRELCRKLEKRQYAREICEFDDRTLNITPSAYSSSVQGQKP